MLSAEEYAQLPDELKYPPHVAGPPVLNTAEEQDLKRGWCWYPRVSPELYKALLSSLNFPTHNPLVITYFMKYIYLISLLFACVSNTNAQCSIKPAYTTDAGTVVRAANFEILYEDLGENNNGNLTKGYIRLHGRLSRYVKANSTVVLWELQVAMEGSRGTEFVPRGLDFYFTTGGVLTVDADTYDKRDGMRICTFKLNSAWINALKNPIRKLEITDTRIDRMFVSTEAFGLYSKVLAEQIACLE